jgi:hypothetical protein
VLKKISVILVVLLSCSSAEENKTKNWFMEFGYQTSITTTHTNFEATFNDESAREISGSGLSDNLYLKIGKSLVFGDIYSFAPSIGFTQASLLGDDYHNDSIYLEVPLFYKTEFFNKVVNIGPSVKYIAYTSLYYNDREGQIDYGFQDAWAFGIQSLWGSGDKKFSLGLEQLTSSNYSKFTRNSSTLLESSIEMNGLYLNFGLQLVF